MAMELKWLGGKSRVSNTETMWHPVESENETFEVEVDLRVSAYPIGADHPFTSISGLLETHPLRDEYLKILGVEE